MQLFLQIFNLWQQLLIRSRLMAVETVKWVIVHTAKNPAAIDHGYEKVYLIAKKLNYLWHNNLFRHNRYRKQVLPIFEMTDTVARNKKLAEIYYAEGKVGPSSSRSILILAAGHGVRWEKSHHKQLATIGDKPIIEHTLNLVPDALVVTRHKRLMQYPHVMPSRCGFVLDTILSTRNMWSERTIILLGDVIFHPDDLETILAFDGDFAVFGSRSQVEIFAISFDRSAHEKVLDHLSIALRDAYTGGRGKIWEMYHSYAGLPLYKVGIGRDFIQLFQTTDVDTYDDYEIVLSERGFKRRA